MQELITRDALARATRMSPRNPIVGIISATAKIPQINSIYQRAWSTDPDEFLRKVFNELNVTIDVSERGLSRIPEHGPFIVVANHPFGAIDGLALLQTIRKRRPDFKVMANFLLQYVEPLKDSFISVNPFEELRSSHSNMTGIKDCMSHVRTGGGLGMFPAGEVSTYDASEHAVLDRSWNTGAIKLISKANVPIVPVHFQGSNSLTFHALGMIHPRLRTLALPSELLKKSGSTISLSIGQPIAPSELSALPDPDQRTRYLRARSYALGYRYIKPKPEVYPFDIPSPGKEVAPATDHGALVDEIAKNATKVISSSGNFDVYDVGMSEAPNIIRELGRLREITFRSVHEGTGQTLDIDEFDRYYRHLVLWDRSASCIVGAYRIGHGPTIMRERGVRGLYLSTLFTINGPAYEMLHSCAELGRSFIVSAYQRHKLALFCLWKGIEAYLTRHPEIKHLVGPVSISSSYRDSSKKLMMAFFLEQARNHPLQGSIEPINPFTKSLSLPAVSDLLRGMEGNIKILDRIVAENEPSGCGIPVLLKKYTAQNGSILAFNTDPSFNNCLDGFLVVHVADIPQSMRQCLNR